MKERDVRKRSKEKNQKK
jgi:hypothetical protein